MDLGVSRLLSGTQQFTQFRRRIARGCPAVGASNESYVLAASSDEWDISDEDLTYDNMIAVFYRYYGICVVLTVCCLSAIGTPLALWALQRRGVSNPRQKVACVARPVAIVTVIVMLWILYPTLKLLTYDVPVWAKILIVLFLVLLAFSWLSVISKAALVNRGLGSPWGQMIFVGAEFGIFMYMLPYIIDMHKLLHDSNDLIEQYNDKTMDDIVDDPTVSDDVRERAQRIMDDLQDTVDDVPDFVTLVYILGGSSLLLAGSTLLLWGLLPLPPVEPLKGGKSDGTIGSRIKSFLCGV